jgi:hypothetical protein
MVETHTRSGTPTDRYGSFETADGDVVLYDREDSTAWIQSNYAIDFEEIGASGPAE